MLPTVSANPTRDEPPSLDTRPRAETVIVEDLVDYARKGRIRVPRFQRKLKWLPEDSRLLFDSIYRGYPIGTLLFWQTKGTAGSLTFGPLRIEADARSDAWWVVDGQQRITSLLRVLAGDDTDTFALWFDLDAERFVGPGARKKEPARFLPLTQVLDSERLLAWVDRAGLSPARKKSAFKLNKRVREYTVPAYVVETDDEEVLRGIFQRTNASGKTLSESDVFDALNGARSRDEPADFKAVAKSLERLGFGALDEAILLRALLAIHGYDAVGGKLPTLEDPPAAYARTGRAMEAAIVFMMKHAGIPRVELLPYAQPLVALAKLYSRHAEPAARSLDLLARWVWRGAWTGLHSGDTVSTRAVLDAIDDDEDASVQRLLNTIPPSPQPAKGPLRPFNFRTARTKLEVLALLSLKPRHLLSSAVLQPVISPNGVLRVIDSGNPLARTIAARLIHPRITKPLVALARAESSVRVSHAVSAKAAVALHDGKFAEFLRIRADTINDVVHGFLVAHAKWDESDRPPIRSLRVADD
jgi:hypothetical protein